MTHETLRRPWLICGCGWTGTHNKLVRMDNPVTKGWEPICPQCGNGYNAFGRLGLKQGCQVVGCTEIGRHCCNNVYRCYAHNYHNNMMTADY